jgi:hypothetical protein
MVKKVLSVILVLTVLLAFAAPAFARWRPEKKAFGPVVLGHPWGDYSPEVRGVDLPVQYRLGTGAGFQGFITAATTSFTVHFYVKYVASKSKDGRVSMRNRGKSD